MAKKRQESPAPATPARDGTTGQFTGGGPDPATEAAAAATLGEIAGLSRAPFRRLLGRFLQAAPDLDALAAHANRNPDRWAQGLAIAGRLAGYSEKLEVDVTGEIHHVHQLSDMELQAELTALDAKLAALPHGPKRLPPGPPASR